MRAKEFITEQLNLFEDFWADVSEFNVHYETVRDLCRNYRSKLNESAAREIDSVKQFFSEFDSVKPIVGNSYWYACINITILNETNKMLDLAKFDKPYQLSSIDHNKMYFSGLNRVIPLPGKYDRGDLIQFVYLFDSAEDLGMFETAVALKFGGTDWLYKTQIINPGVKRMNENASGGATGSGSIATINTVLGAPIRRNNSSIFSGSYSADEYPNTPKHIRDQATKWKSSNASRKS